MDYSLPNIQDLSVKGKRVFVRCDFDVPLIKQSAISNQQSVIIDETRLISGISTIEYLLEEGAIVIGAGHLGRPDSKVKSQKSKVKSEQEEFSLYPIVKWYEEQFGVVSKKTLIGSFEGWEINKNFYVLENLRFYDDEEERGEEFSRKLSKLADIYINEAFGASHRNHASIVGIPKYIPHFAGFHFIKEVKILSRILDSPKRPLTVIIGGAKIDTKLPMVSSMHSFADYVLVGGEIAEKTKVLMHEAHRKIIGQKADLLVAHLNEDKTDITKTSLSEFKHIIKKSNMIVWNGPMGEISSKFPPVRRAGKVQSSKLNERDGGYTSLKLAEAITASSAYKVVGGGDTIGLLNKHKLLEKFDFVSMGGGAMLEFLSGKSLPGIKALQTST